MTTTSTQYITSIDEHFPIPGKDNDSQGFRNNFANIKQAFGIINSDINSLDLSISAINSDPVLSQFLSANTEGFPTMENMFINPYLDIWSNGPADAPDGTVLTAASVSQTTSTVYPQSNTVSAEVTINTASSSSGLAVQLQEPWATWPESRDISVLVAVRVPAGQPSVRVYGGNQSSANPTLIAQVDKKDEWVAVRGTFSVDSGYSPEVKINCWNGSTYTTGTFYVGGCTLVNGTWAPKYLADNGRRSEYIVGNVSYPPAFVGQRAIVSATIYMSIGTTTSTNWIAIN